MASFSGFVIDPAKCSALSLEEKRELVHQIFLRADNAPEILQSWSRRELLELICAEMGKQRKYTGVTKPRMIEHLLRLMSQKNIVKKLDSVSAASSILQKNNSVTRKKRKKEQPLQLAIESDHASSKNSDEEQSNTLICENLACQATLSPEDAFCKRCSCSICYRYDDNKDPSLWLICNSDPPYQSISCGASCHIKCALKNERTGIVKNGCYAKLDGSFYCVLCGKVNGLIGSWRKQLLIAKDARRVYVLCHRISLSHNILKGTERYKELQAIVDTAAKKLRKEVGPLDKVSAKMARGIVNRLACGQEIQKLCAFAVEEVDSMVSGISEPVLDADVKAPNPPTFHIKFEDVSPVSVTVSMEYGEDEVLGEDVIGYKLWHRKSGVVDYAEEPTCIIQRPERRAMISGLSPSTEYCFKVSFFSSTRESGKWEASWITQTAKESNNSSSPRSLDGGQERGKQPGTVQPGSQRGSTNSSGSHQDPKKPRTCQKNLSKFLSLEDTDDNSEKHLPPPSGNVPFVCSNSVPLETPSKSDGLKAPLDSTNKKEFSERQYEYCVKIIRWLECEGHMEKEFRVKFLTWFSLKATAQERRVVNAFIDVLIDEPASLVDQLVDAFMDGICNREKAAVQKIMCTKLWH